MGQAIGFYIVADDNPNADLQVNNVPFLFLGEGYYLFDSLIVTRSYYEVHEKQYNAVKVAYIYDDEKCVDLDIDYQRQIVYRRFLEIWEDTKKLSRSGTFKGWSQFFWYLCEMYKEIYEIDLISLTLTDRVSLYKKVKSEIPYVTRTVIEGQRFHCVSKTARARIMLHVKETRK